MAGCICLQMIRSGESFALNVNVYTGLSAFCPSHVAYRQRQWLSDYVTLAGWMAEFSAAQQVDTQLVAKADQHMPFNSNH